MKYILPVILCLFFLSVNAQNLTNKELRKLERIRKHELKEAAYTRQLNQIALLIDAHRFILTAHQLRDNNGKNYFVSESLNFIQVDSSIATIQIGDARGMGSNGLGGFTINGTVTHYVVNHTPDNTPQNVQFVVSSPQGNFNIHINISGNANNTALVSSTLYKGYLTFTGEITPLRRGQVFKGFGN